MVDAAWHAQETFKSLTNLAIEALKFASLINGGAAIAVVAYGLGKLPNVALAAPMAFFLLGTVLSGFAYICAYVTQLAVFNESANLRNGMAHHGMWLRATGILGLSAIVTFACGCMVVVITLQD